MASNETYSESRFLDSSLNFSDIKGNIELKLLFIILAIDPSISGLIIFGDKGTGKSFILKKFRYFQIPKYINEIQADNAQEKNYSTKNTPLNVSYYNKIYMPPNTPLDTMMGNLDFNMNFCPGILSKANEGFLIIDDLHLMPYHNLNILSNVWQYQKNIIHRHSVSFSHPSNFCLLASVPQNDHGISQTVLDRFAFSYFLEYDNSIEQRLAIMNSNLLDDASSLLTSFKTNKSGINSLQLKLIEARNNLSRVTIDAKNLELISRLCLLNQIDGIRADIFLTLGTRALASFQGRRIVTEEDILFLAPFVLKHRIKEDEQILLYNYPIHKSSDHKKIPNHSKTNEKSFKKEDENKTSSIIKDTHQRRRKFLGYFGAIFGILIFSFSLTLIIVILTSNPGVFLSLLSGIILWSIVTLLIILWIRKKIKIRDKLSLNDVKKHSKPDISSFSKVKQFRPTETPQESKKQSNKEIVLDLEEDKSRKGKILRFIGIQPHKGMITLSGRQGFWITIIGVLILFLSLIFYTYLILIVPPETWIFVLLFILSLFTIGYVRQAMQKEHRVKRVADIGASQKETSSPLNVPGIGSYIAPISTSQQNSSFLTDYKENLLNNLTDVKRGSFLSEKEMGIQLVTFNEYNDPISRGNRVINTSLPLMQKKIDSIQRSKSGKRALSITTLHSGRVIGAHPFKEYPKNIHILATIRNAVIRKYRERRKIIDRKIEIKLEDIYEKTFCGRVSATIIFVLDLSESITSVINIVSNTVNWLSRQAYLYRDRVGLVVLKGIQGVIIQPPTSNLNLVKRKLRDLRVSGSTPLASGLQKALDLIKFDRIRNKDEVIPMIILISDGATNIPLLNDPITGIARITPLSELGIDLAVKMAIKDCINMCHQIKKKNISLTMFSTNLRGEILLKQIQQDSFKPFSEFLENLMTESDLSRGKDFIRLWSMTLLRVMQEVSGGNLFFLKKKNDLNLEVLRNARTEMLSSMIK